MGEAADVVVAFNEQVLYSRIDDGALREGTILLLENVWADSYPDEGRSQAVLRRGTSRTSRNGVTP